MELITDYKSAYENINKAIHDYLTTYPNIQSLVIGISGGIDSALMTAIAHYTTRNTDVELKARTITIDSNCPDEISRSKSIGEVFANDYRCVDLSDGLSPLRNTLMEDIENENADTAFKIRLGNIKARMRMMYLYDLAHKSKGMVLSTDNYTEYLLGFWTLHGDVGDFGALQNLWKTEVYGIAEYLKEQLPQRQASALGACIDALPTDGLGITSSDMEQIGGSSYFEVDKILQDIIAGNENENDTTTQKIKQRHLGSAFKRMNPYNIPREDILRR